ncbi:hypothetical protein ACFSTC_54540 [Nonomuraea ferruginea]
MIDPTSSTTGTTGASSSRLPAVLLSLEGGHLPQVTDRPGQVEEDRPAADAVVDDAGDEGLGGEGLQVGQGEVGEQGFEGEPRGLGPRPVDRGPDHAQQEHLGDQRHAGHDDGAAVGQGEEEADAGHRA